MSCMTYALLLSEEWLAVIFFTWLLMHISFLADSIVEFEQDNEDAYELSPFGKLLTRSRQLFPFLKKSAIQM